MNVLSIENLSKTLKDEPLFSSVSLGLEEGDHVGLVGRNGTGKTTFLRLISGEIEPDSGNIAINNQCEIQLLDQTVSFDETDTILDYFLNSDNKRSKIYKSFKTASTAEEISKLTLQMDHLDAWNIVNDFKIYLKELKIDEKLDCKMKNLSGGTIKKISIARLLALKPNLMLLDEPTNHLDIPSINWLEKKIKDTKATVITVTHDRYFLNRVCNQIMEIEHNQVFLYSGDYTKFLEQRRERLNSMQKEQDRLKTVLRRELVWLQRGPKARAGKDSSRKQRIEDMLDAQKTINIESQTSFSSVSKRLGKKILEINNISKSFDNNFIIKDFSFNFTKGQRIGIIGTNGCGKTTLLDLITGNLAPDSGTVDVGVNTLFSYYDQISRNLPLDKIILEYITDISPLISLSSSQVVSAAKFLELFGFDSSFHRLPISVLSGGEKRRLYLISCLAANPNFLVLDEPTNDLDIDTIRNLEQYILDFSGCVLTVSHDRAFLDRTCSTLFVLEREEGLQTFKGTFSDYEDYHKQKLDKINQEKRESSSNKRTINREKKGLSYRENQEFEALTEKIEELENNQKEIEEYFTSGKELEKMGEKTKEYDQIKKDLESSYKRWEELAGQL